MRVTHAWHVLRPVHAVRDVHGLRAMHALRRMRSELAEPFVRALHAAQRML